MSFRFVHGWCRVTIVDDITSLTLGATTMHDAFGDLVTAFVALGHGSRCQSVMWGGEGRGWFLDLAVDGVSGLGIAVHTMRDSEWHIASRRWRPVRDRVVLEAYGNLGPVVVRLADELRRIELAEVDGSGFMPQWGWKFPRAGFAELERLAVPFGYRPQPGGEHRAPST